MTPVYVHDPANIPWQMNLFDVVMLTIFVFAAVYSIVQFRRGRRVYVALMVTAFIYGLVLELGGMATHNSYTQGTFAVMLNWPALPLFHDSTQMPSYVPIFYPVILFVGYRVIEALGIQSRWRAAITGGLLMIAIDAPYIIEGGLRHVVWWTWHNWTMYQLWLGWPLVDLWWQATWDALFFYLMLRALPRLNSTVGGPAQWSNAKALVGFPLVASVTVLIIGPFLHLPLAAVTYLGGPQWPLVIVLVVAYAVVAVAALRKAQPQGVEAITIAVVGVYAVGFAAMIAANVVYEHGVTLYIAVQSLGLLVLCGFVAFPALARHAALAQTSGGDGAETGNRVVAARRPL
jgi:hypothetical protein